MYQLQCSLKNSSYVVKKNTLLPKHLSRLVNNNKTLNLNVASYSLNILAYPDISTWFATGVPIYKKKHIGLTKNHQKTI